MKNHIFGYLIPSVSKSHNNVSGCVCVFSVSLCVTETDENVFLFFYFSQQKKKDIVKAEGDDRKMSSSFQPVHHIFASYLVVFFRTQKLACACMGVCVWVYLNKKRVIQFQFLPSNGSTKTRKGCRRGRPEGKVLIFGNFSGCLLFFWGKVFWFFFYF